MPRKTDGKRGRPSAAIRERGCKLVGGRFEGQEPHSIGLRGDFTRAACIRRDQRDARRERLEMREAQPFVGAHAQHRVGLREEVRRIAEQPRTLNQRPGVVCFDGHIQRRNRLG